VTSALARIVDGVVEKNTGPTDAPIVMSDLAIVQAVCYTRPVNDPSAQTDATRS
jgi:hypothetical protein